MMTFRAIAATLLVATLLAVSPMLAADAPGQVPLHAVCGLERPVIEAEADVTVTVLTNAPAGTALRVAWSATGGTFSDASKSNPVHWSPPGGAPGVYTLTAKVAAPSGETATCATEVVVISPAHRGPTRGPAAADAFGREAARALLSHGSNEAPGFGLYSYILFAARPDEDNSARFRAVLKSYLALEDVRLEEEAGFSPAQLNVTYVPIDRPVPDDFDQRDDRIGWILDHYDYSRARFLLSRMQDAQGYGPEVAGDGPYIVSCLHPLNGSDGPGALISENLTSVPIGVVPDWMRQFHDLTTQRRVYEKRSIETLALDLRTAIGTFAEGVPVVLTAITVWTWGGAK